MQLDPQTAIAIAIPTVSVVVWLVRLEGRINLSDSQQKDIKSDLAEIKADVKTLLVAKVRD